MATWPVHLCTPGPALAVGLELEGTDRARWSGLLLSLSSTAGQQSGLKRGWGRSGHWQVHSTHTSNATLHGSDLWGGPVHGLVRSARQPSPATYEQNRAGRWPQLSDLGFPICKRACFVSQSPKVTVRTQQGKVPKALARRRGPPGHGSELEMIVREDSRGLLVCFCERVWGILAPVDSWGH